MTKLVAFFLLSLLVVVNSTPIMVAILAVIGYKVWSARHV